MATKDDGGPAFPQSDLSGYGMGPPRRGEGEHERYAVNGMSMREYLAIHATDADVACIMARGASGLSIEVRVRARYEFADAMIAASRASS